MREAASETAVSCRVAGIHVNMLKRKKPPRKRSKADSSDPVAYKQRSIVGSKVQHGWREKTGVVTQWKGTVLDQLPVNPSLFLVKYDDFDCVYGIELFKDERVSGLEILPNKSGRTKIMDGDLAELIVGKAVEHMFEKDDGSKNEWRGMVLARAPVMTTWYYITYEKDPVLYMYQLLEDYKEGDLRILPDSENKQVLPTEPGEVIESLVGKQVEYVTEDGTKRTGYTKKCPLKRPCLTLNSSTTWIGQEVPDFMTPTSCELSFSK